MFGVYTAIPLIQDNYLRLETLKFTVCPPESTAFDFYTVKY